MASRAEPQAALGMLSRVPLRDQAVEVLREMVVSGALEGGERINEAELAARLGISRGPLREAIQRLGAEGFIEFRRNRGAFVRKITLEDVRYMYEAREIVEVKAAMLAAARASQAGVEQLRAMLGQVGELLDANEAGPYPAGLDLHMLVLELSGNPYLQRAGTDLQNQVRLARITSGNSPERARQALAEHHEIIAGIAARDADAAGRAMSFHLHQSLSSLLEITSESDTTERA
jgi:DNA-binding GntR family transcriptional regulator